MSNQITSTHLTQQHCVPCEGGTAPLNQEQEEMYLSAVPSWEINRDEPLHWLVKVFTFKNFTETISFLNAIAVVAEEQGHHPNLKVFDFKNLKVCLSTHAIKGLSENDFILAAKIDELLPIA